MADQNSDKLVISGQALLHGLRLHGTWINAPQDVTTMLETKLHRFQETLPGADAARTTATMAKTRVAVADRALKSWLTKARLVVMLARGVRWSESWVHTGFTDSKIKVPNRLDGRIALGRALVTFFARHPELGVPFAEITAARGRAICERAAQSSEMLDLAKKDHFVMNQQRQLAESDLRNAVRKVTGWLKTNLDAFDNRWADFGIVVSVRSRPGSRNSARQRVSTIRFSHSGPEPHHVAAA